MLEKEVYITCPICGQEMLPVEVYIPEEFFGKPKEIIRDTSGKIDFYLGSGMDLDEEYICDNCGTPLSIHANLSFTATAKESEDFNSDYVSKFNKPKKIKLEEETLF